jgi:hypothetical protein
MTVTKVLIDGGAGLNIIFADTLKKIGLDFAVLLTHTDVPFYGTVPRKAAMPLGWIMLPVTFGALDNYRTEFIKFEVADFESSRPRQRRPPVAQGTNKAATGAHPHCRLQDQ